MNEINLNAVKEFEKDRIYNSPFVDSILDMCPHLTRDEIAALIMKVDFLKDKSFFAFRVEKEYLNLLNIEDEKTLKTLVAEAFDYNRFKNANKLFNASFSSGTTELRPIPSYELIDALIEKTCKEYGHDVSMASISYYLFMKAFLHLVWKVLFRIADVSNMKVFLIWSSHNLDSVLTTDINYKNANKNKRRESIARYTINNAKNTIEYDDTVKLVDNELFFTNIVKTLPKIFSVAEADRILDTVDQESVSRLIIDYICTLMELSRTDNISMCIRICSHCGELFLDNNSKTDVDKAHDELCQSCKEHIENNARVIITSGISTLKRHFPKLHEKLKQ